jgi:steroid delta-isomerase-like uncharacterized protein
MVSEQVKANVIKFFELVEQGVEFDAVKEFVTPDATFSSDALPDISTLAAYVAWMKGISHVTMPGSKYELHSVTTNENTVVFFATFIGTHSGEGGPVPPTGKTMVTRYVYVISVNESGKVTGLDKIWNINDAFKQLGWA